MIDLFDFLGLVGVFLSLYAYARVQWRREYVKRLDYSVINFVGACLLNVAVWDKWNIASFIGNAVWGVISLYGIYRCLKYSRRQGEAALLKSGS